MASDALRYRIGAYRGDEPYAFVSYAHEDAEVVFAELAAFTAHGVRFYYDEGIHPGHTWHDELAKAIERCAVFVLFVTARSVASRNCQRELAFALDNDKPVVAVHLEDTELPSGVRLAIGDRQAIVRSRFDEERYRERLIAAIREHVGAPRPDASHAPNVASIPHAQKAMRIRWPIGAGLGLLALAIGGYLGFSQWSAARELEREHDAALAEIESLVKRDEYGAAFGLAREWIARDADGRDERLRALWKEITLAGKPLVADSGVSVSYKAYDDVDGEWIAAGVTPIEAPLDLPRGVVRIRLEKSGFRNAELVVANPGPSIRGEEVLPVTLQNISPVPLVLAEEGKLADDMVFVPTTNIPVFLGGWTPSLFGDYRFEVPEFGISRFEVTNAEFKEFVDAGGYDNATYWDGLEYRDGAQTLTREEARARFIDRTGRPGPAEWELSSFADGQADLPVVGVSWYEAVAYARFRHLSLPTIHHWLRASLGPFEGIFATAPMVARASRFLADGPVEARSSIGLGPWGTYNTAGNVREWMWNAVGAEVAAIGGSWRDYSSTYQLMQAARPMDRLPDLGFRLMKSFGPVDSQLLAAISIPIDPEFVRRQPVSNDAFEAMRFQFTAAAPKPQGVNVERIHEADTWTLEEVVLAFGDDETFSIYVAIPRGVRGKLQPILYGPAGDAFALPRPNRDVIEQFRTVDVVMNGRRALVIPIWSGTYQRAVALSTDVAARADRLRVAALRWYEDAAKTIAYLETREDMDVDRVGYVGFSSGGLFIGPPILAVNSRVKAAVLIGAGLSMNRIPPMSDAVHYAPRIHCPVLMINGRYDTVYPYEPSQLRMFELLGTAPADKKQILYDGGHFAFPRNLLAKEMTDWFDKYLGPVK